MIDEVKIAKAISDFRNSNGTKWKSKLKESWLNGSLRVPELINLRNYFNFDTLDKIKSHTIVEEIVEILKKNRY